MSFTGYEPDLPAALWPKQASRGVLLLIYKPRCPQVACDMQPSGKYHYKVI